MHKIDSLSVMLTVSDNIPIRDKAISAGTNLQKFSQTCEERMLRSFVMFVRLYVRMEQLSSHWRYFNEFWYLMIFRKSVEKIQVSLQFDKNNGHFTLRPIYFLITSRSIILRVRNVSDRLVEKIEVHILCSMFFFEIYAVYEIMWKNTVKLDKPEMTIWFMHIARWIQKATNT